MEPKPFYREEISSWYLSSDTKIDESTLIKVGFKKFAHIEETNCAGHFSFDVFNRPIFRKGELLLEVRYSSFNGYAGMFITNESKQLSYPVYESWNYSIDGKGFKSFIRHRVLKMQASMEAGYIPNRINKSWMFESDSKIITYY